MGIIVVDCCRSSLIVDRIFRRLLDFLIFVLLFVVLIRTYVTGTNPSSHIDCRIIDVVGSLVGYIKAKITRTVHNSKRIQNSSNKSGTRKKVIALYTSRLGVRFLFEAQTCVVLTICGSNRDALMARETWDLHLACTLSFQSFFHVDKFLFLV